MTGNTFKYLIGASAFASLATGFYDDEMPQGKRRCNDTNANRKARKERARMLTRKREEELRAQKLSQKNAG